MLDAVLNMDMDQSHSIRIILTTLWAQSCKHLINPMRGPFDQERKEADDIDWSKIVEQAQARQSGSMIRYQALKKKPITVAQASGSEPFQEQSTEEPKELSEEDLKEILAILNLIKCWFVCLVQ
ncbi:hypothetical protein Tco_0762059 [Tanacetum coccineum]